MTLRKATWRSAFTMIELLVVIAIISILAAIVLRTTSLVNQKVQHANALAALNRIRSSIEAFHAYYGVYPPVNQAALTYHVFGGWFYTNQSMTAWESHTGDPRDLPGSEPMGGRYYTTGLVYYLLLDVISPTPGKPTWSYYIRDLIWPPYPSGRDAATGHKEVGNQTTAWRGMRYDFNVPAAGSFYYSSDPPYQSYRLSCGAISTNEWD